MHRAAAPHVGGLVCPGESQGERNVPEMSRAASDIGVPAWFCTLNSLDAPPIACGGLVGPHRVLPHCKSQKRYVSASWTFQTFLDIGSGHLGTVGRLAA